MRCWVGRLTLDSDKYIVFLHCALAFKLFPSLLRLMMIENFQACIFPTWVFTSVLSKEVLVKVMQEPDAMSATTSGC